MSRPHPWVAHIVGFDEQFGYKRVFMPRVYDYSHASKSGKGTVIYFFLPPGLYEIYEPVSWKRDERYFIRANHDGTYEQLNREELDKCLKNEC